MARTSSLLIVAFLTLVVAAEASVGHFGVTNSGLTNYAFAGLGNDPVLTLVRGQTYTFNLNAPGHPFWIKTIAGTGTGNAYNDGVSGNGTAVGTVTFSVPHSAPDTLFYNCEIHAAMTGTINILDAPPPLVPGLSGSGLVVLGVLIAAAGALQGRLRRLSAGRR